MSKRKLRIKKVHRRKKKSAKVQSWRIKAKMELLEELVAKKSDYSRYVCETWGFRNDMRRAEEQIYPETDGWIHPCPFSDGVELPIYA